MKKTILRFTAILILFATAQQTQATIINVPADSTTIQAAINGTSHGDTVLVQPGTYFENINFNGKNITVASLFLLTQDTAYISQTVIDGGQNGSAVIIENNEDANARLIGLTVQNGLASSGGGVYISNASPQIEFVKISSNVATNRGGGIFIDNTSSNPKFISLCICNNHCDQNGGGIFCSAYKYSDVYITNCLITNNYAGYHGSAAYLHCPNSGNYSDILVLNSTITSNFSDETHAAFKTQYTARVEVVNSIIWDNGINQMDLNSNTSFSNCCIDYDPLFYDSQNNYYSLQETSPCINAGILQDELPETDIVMNPRISQVFVDIGAYEFQLTTDFIYCEFGNEDYKIYKFGDKIPITWISNIDSVKIEFSADSIQWQTVVDSVFNTPEYLWTVPQVQTENAFVRLSKSMDSEVFDVNDVHFSIYKTVFHDGDTISGNWSIYNSPVIIMGEAILPLNSILTIDPGVEVKLLTDVFETQGWLRIHGTLLAQGTENDSIYFTRLGDEGNWKNIYFHGSGSSNSNLSFCNIQYADECYYSGEWAYGAVSFRLSSASVSNTFFVNNASRAIHTRFNSTHPSISHCKILGGLLIHDDGAFNVIENEITGYIYLNDASISEISGNKITMQGAPYGYAIEATNGSWADVVNNEINGSIRSTSSSLKYYNNHIRSGGYGIWLREFSNAHLENNIIEDIASYGIRCDASDAIIENCTFSNVSTAVIVNYTQSEVSFENCIFHQNTNTFSENSFYFGMQNCLLDDDELPYFVADLGGNILNADPQFLNSGDHPYQLSPASPAINEGYVNSNLVQETDLMSNPRVSKGRIDIGAYEYQETGEWLWLTSPTGDEYFETGTTYPITWARSDSTSTVKIEFFNGNTWEVVENATPNTGEYDSWIAPTLDADNCLFRIIDNGSGISHEMEEQFHIKKNIIYHEENVAGIWTLAESPFCVIGSARVSSNDTLIIEPGVVVQFRTGNVNFYDSEFFNIGMFYIYGSGTLLAEGTATNPITFTRDGSDGYWGVINFRNSATSMSKLKHCVIEYTNSYYPNSEQYFGGVSFRVGYATIENCIFRNCLAGVLSAHNSTPIIRNNTFYLNYDGGVACWKSSNTEIINNLFFGNQYYGIWCYESSPKITNNTLTFSGMKPRISIKPTNLRLESDMEFKPENKNFVYGLYLQNGSDPFVENTIIYGNGIYEEGENIHLEGGSNPTISYSLLSNETLPDGAIDGGNNIFDQNPKFNDPTKLDFSLSAASPCINTGNPDTANFNLPEFDLANNPRIYENSAIDMGAYEFQAMVQRMELATGWSGLSSWVNPQKSDIEVLFDPIITDLIILQNESGMFWPGQNINTLGNWNTHIGYQIKISDTTAIAFAGSRESNQTLSLADNWNLIPVLSECDVDVENLFSGTDIIIVKEVAGWDVYWPAFGINSLEILEPGKAYFVLMTQEAEITFPECSPIMTPSPTLPLEGKGADPGSNHQYDRRGTLNKNSNVQRNVTARCAGTPSLRGEVKKTATTHTIALPKEAVTNLQIPIGSLIKAFDNSGNCFGVGIWQGDNTSITLFGDDPLTNVKGGFYEDDEIVFKIIGGDAGQELILKVEFDQSLPDNDGIFRANGLSAIKTLNASATQISFTKTDEIQIYPNPAKDILHIELKNEGAALLQIMNCHGKKVQQQYLEHRQNSICIAQLPKGLYFLKIAYNNKQITRKLVVH